MGTFDELVGIVARLRGPQGCPVDRKQTLEGCARDLREEAEELFEAIESGDTEHMKEEVGDLVWTLLFFSQIAKEESLFTIEEALEDIKEKIIRRHQHVFGNVRVNSVEEIHEKWKGAKEKERRARKR